MRRLAVAGAALGAGVLSLGLTAPVLAHSLGAAPHPASPAGLPAALAIFANPTITFGLLLLAMLGIGLEMVHPGAIVPGVVGLIAGVLAVAGLLGLPLDLLGLLLVAAAAALFMVDTVAPTHGVLTVVGIGAAITGGVLMFPGRPVAPVALVGLPLGLGGIWVLLSHRALAVRHRPYPRQPQELLGEVGVVKETRGEPSLALVDGELWRIISRDGAPVAAGDEVEVLAQDGLTLIVATIGLSGGSEIKGGGGERMSAPALPNRGVES
ncbi:MAG: NfeD family protein [Candidatus Dormibacteria bacterium]